jgi:hypothetical protein
MAEVENKIVLGGPLWKIISTLHYLTISLIKL